MNPTLPVETAYEFGDYWFEPFNARLICQGRVIPLTAKGTELLRQLVERPDLLVTKEALMAAVWPDTAVDENNLNQQISLLRKTLGRDREQELIETVPRRGYRFVAPVRKIEALPATLSADATGRTASAERRSWFPFSRVLGRPLWIVTAAAVVTLATAVVLTRQSGEQRRLIDESERAFERGEALLAQGNAQAAVAALQRAIGGNPNHARAYERLAHALNKYSSKGAVVAPPKRSPSVEAAARSVAIDPQCAGCRGTLGLYLVTHDWQWSAAEEQFREAIRLAPDLTSVRPAYALLLIATGRLTEALQQVDVALAKEPFHVGWQSIRASILYADRRFEGAIAAADRVLAIDDQQRDAWEWRSRALFRLGRGEEAMKALTKVAFRSHAGAVELTARTSGTEAGLRELLRITGGWNDRTEQSWRRAPWLLMLNDVEGALDELQLAYDTRKYHMLYLGVDPVYDAIRDHPRYQKLLADMGLAEWFTDEGNGK
jgi:DNA-binding winged helix-turn-helix (wHTH) protein/Tfp pilus assembly protein PilF